MGASPWGFDSLRPHQLSKGPGWALPNFPLPVAGEGQGEGAKLYEISPNHPHFAQVRLTR
jgi:hypothetical protein